MNTITRTTLTALILAASSAALTQAAVMVKNNGDKDVVLLAVYSPLIRGGMLPGSPIVSTPLAKGAVATIDFQHEILGKLSSIGIDGQTVSMGTWTAIEQIIKEPTDGDYYTLELKWSAALTSPKQLITEKAKELQTVAPKETKDSSKNAPVTVK
ncbi:hypothetical protein CVU75_01315 [Candidatus Dependentiae bacterium HGW-Dependentiae-1]|nr:MAG: hypothetical protein CVU75_01315 [Candidatus Dependentiae bacterium HGW-Dependentiae-1]